MSLCTILRSCDPSLDRLDYTTPFDQALMEMLVFAADQDFLDLDEIQDENGNYIDCCDWWRVTCTDDRVTAIDFEELQCSEMQFPFSYIPSRVTHFNLTCGNAHGTLDPAILPENLIELAARVNCLHGEISMKQFPRKMQRIEISKNEFKGSLVIADIPRPMLYFLVYHNYFTGTISFDSMPENIRSFDIDENKLSGTLQIKNLPASLFALAVGGNDFTGDFQLLGNLANLRFFSIANHKFSGTIVLEETSNEMPFGIEANYITKVIDENGNPHTWEKEILEDSESSDIETHPYDE